MGNESRPAVLTPGASGRPVDIDALFHAHRPAIESWFDARWRDVAPPFYASVDLRHAGFKLAPIDTNLFPAGFNNLQSAFHPRCATAFAAEMKKVCPSARGVVLVPENHTRNLFYFENLATLVDILGLAQLKVRIGSLLPDLVQPRTIELPSGRTITLEPLQREGDKLHVGDFEPCLVLLNNDLSTGAPPILEGLRQPIVPPLALGWSHRRKSKHFTHYREVAAEFATIASIDPWLVDPVFRNCGQINFQRRQGEECLLMYADEVLQTVAKKYAEFGIEREPFVVIKADAGTYGMAIMMVKSADEVRELNRKQRTKMAHAKEGQAVTQVLVQEGIPSTERFGIPAAAGEPVMYMVGKTVVGGFYRVHPERGATDNLNAPGMGFEPMTDTDGRSTHPSPRFYAYEVAARLALLAAARELKEASP